MRFRYALVPVLFCAFAGVRGAQAQMDSREGIALQNQILELRAQVQQLQQQGQGGGYGPGPSSAPLRQGHSVGRRRPVEQRHGGAVGGAGRQPGGAEP